MPHECIVRNGLALNLFDDVGFAVRPGLIAVDAKVVLWGFLGYLAHRLYIIANRVSQMIGVCYK